MDLDAIAKDAAERVHKNGGCVPQLAFAPILWALQDAVTHDVNNETGGYEAAGVVSPNPADEVALAVEPERGSAAWFRQRAGRLGCDNWRGPDTVRYAADVIEGLTDRLASLQAAYKEDGEAMRWIATTDFGSRDGAGWGERENDLAFSIYEIKNILAKRLQSRNEETR